MSFLICLAQRAIVNGDFFVKTSLCDDKIHDAFAFSQMSANQNIKTWLISSVA